MWCFFDESWVENGELSLMAVGGVLLSEEVLPAIDDLLYNTRKKYFGVDHAKDPSNELKGNQLLSNSTFKLQKRSDIDYVKNIAVVKEVLGGLIKLHETQNGCYVKAFASVVFGDKPQLLCPEIKKAPYPYRILCKNISHAVSSFDNSRSAIQIFDQRVKVQEQLAITLRSLNLGLGLSNIHPVPYFGISHASYGLQVADIIVYIVAKQMSGDKRFQKFYDMVTALTWEQKNDDGRKYYGINAWEEYEPGKYRKRNASQKRRAGAPGRS